MTDALCLTFILVGTAFSFISFVAPNPSSLQLLIHIRNSSASLGYFYISRAKNHGVALRNPPHFVCSGKNNTPSPILILKWDRESFNKGLGDWNVGGDNGGVKGTDDSGMKMEAFIFYLDLVTVAPKHLALWLLSHNLHSWFHELPCFYHFPNSCLFSLGRHCGVFVPLSSHVSCLLWMTYIYTGHSLFQQLALSKSGFISHCSDAHVSTACRSTNLLIFVLLLF